MTKIRSHADWDNARRARGRIRAKIGRCKYRVALTIAGALFGAWLELGYLDTARHPVGLFVFWILLFGSVGYACGRSWDQWQR